MAFLLALLPDFLKVWLGFKANEAESLGKSEQKATDLQAALNVSQAEAQAAADAPQGDALIEALKNGKVSLVLLSLLLLTNCAQNVTRVCLTKTSFTKTQEAEMAANLSTLPPDSPLRAMGDDWSKLRNQVDSCNHVH